MYSYSHVKRYKILGNKTELLTAESTGVRNKDMRRKEEETGEKG
jgi:hypothetical protein